jgi:hypothetical protein
MRYIGLDPEALLLAGKDHHTRNVAMRTRAYRPEVPGCLEERSLLSGVAGLSADPVVFRQRQFNFVLQHMSGGFDLFARNRDIFQIPSEINDVIVMIPFGRVDGLGVSINHIVNRMRHDISAHVPHAARSALFDVLAVTRAQVEARVRAGDVIVR